MKSAFEIMEIVNHSTGTPARHRFSPLPGYPVATDGAIAVAEAAECYWLLDVVGSYQSDRAFDPEFQVWTLEVDLEESSGVVKGYNDRELIVTQEISFTDFPLEELKLYLIDGVIMLPSEY